MTDLRELRALAEAASPGPWNADVHDNGSARVYFAPDATDERPEMADWIPAHGYGVNAQYIAAADPQTVLALIATIERVQALIALDNGVWLPKDTKIKRVQEDRRHDLGAIVTTSMVTVDDVRAALDMP